MSEKWHEPPRFIRPIDKNVYRCTNCGMEYLPRDMKAIMAKYKRDKNRLIKQLHKLFAETLEQSLIEADKHFIEEAEKRDRERK